MGHDNTVRLNFGLKPEGKINRTRGWAVPSPQQVYQIQRQRVLFLGIQVSILNISFGFLMPQGPIREYCSLSLQQMTPRPLYSLTLCVCWAVFTSYCSQSVSSFLFLSENAKVCSGPFQNNEVSIGKGGAQTQIFFFFFLSFPAGQEPVASRERRVNEGLCKAEQDVSLLYLSR